LSSGGEVCRLVGSSELLFGGRREETACEKDATSKVTTKPGCRKKATVLAAVAVAFECLDTSGGVRGAMMWHARHARHSIT